MRLCVGIALGVLLAGSSSSAKDVVLLRPSSVGVPLDDDHLLQAVRTFTQDLGLEWRTDDAAGEDEPLRAACWCEALAMPDGQVEVHLLIQTRGEPRPGKRLLTRGVLDDSLYRTLALKIRSVLASTSPTPGPVAAPARADSRGLPSSRLASTPPLPSGSRRR